MVFGIGCKEPPAPPKKAVSKVDLPATKAATKQAKKPPPEGVYTKFANTRGACRRTLCVGGPGEPSSDAHRDFGELCRRAPGIVMRCEGEKLCSSVWPVDDWQPGLEAILANLASLDKDGDGKISDADPACLVSVAGWSLGGVVAAVDVPAAFAADPRTSGSRTQIENLVAVAPYRPGLERLEIATNVNKAFIYRQTKPPESDCSRGFEGGPWLSPAPVCPEGSTCYDYDYGQDDGTLAYLSRRGARSGAAVGHCNMTALLALIGLDNLARGQESFHELIPPYSDGSHGGREHVPGPAVPDPILPLPNPVQPD